MANYKDLLHSDSLAFDRYELAARSYQEAIVRSDKNYMDLDKRRKADRFMDAIKWGALGLLGGILITR